jgi:hypothetical protein
MSIMRKSIIPVLAVAFIIVISQFCSKGGGGGNGGCTETGVTITTTPALNTVDPPAPGPDFPLTVNVANLPTAGVTIVVKAAPESPAGAAAFFTESRPSTSSTNSFTITGTPTATSCIVTVTVTSKSCATNSTSGTYRYSRK